MKTGSHPVKMRLAGPDGKKTSQEVGTANFPIYDEVQEAIDEVGEAAVLALINAQTRTNELNRIRGLKRAELEGSLPARKLTSLALQRAMASGRLAEVAGDEEAIDKLLEDLKREIRAELQAKAQESILAGGDDDEDEDND